MPTQPATTVPSSLIWGDRPVGPVIERVVVPRASTAGHEPAMAMAVDLAHRYGWPIHAVSVAVGDSVDLADPAKALKAAHPEVAITAATVHAEADAVTALADILSPSDLVVMVTDAGADDGTSFAQDLTHAWGGPVMMLGPACPKEHLGDGSVAVALDGSALAERALPFAHEFASLLDAPLTLVQIVSSSVTRQVQKLAERGERVAESAYVDDLASLLGEAGVPAAWTIVHDDDAVRGLRSHVAEHDVAVLVMATHGHGGLPRPAFGSTCLDAVRHAGVPVVVIRPTGTPTVSIDLTAGDE